MGGEAGRTGGSETFGAEVTRAVEKLLRVQFDDQLQRDLDQLTVTYRAVARSIPSKLRAAPADLDLSKQMQWFEDNVIKPTETLVNALSADRHRMRTAMNPDVDTMLGVDQLAPALQRFLSVALRVHDDMDYQLVEGIRNKDQLQYEVLAALADLFKRQLGKDFTQLPGKVIDEVLRIACGEVVGQTENMPRLIRHVRRERLQS
jgi:hypothetical protein